MIWLLACSKPDPHFAGWAGRDALVLVTHQNDCPVLEQYSPTLKDLPAEFPGVHFTFLNGSPHDSPEEITERIAEFDLDWPFLRDEEQAILQRYEIYASAEALVLETKGFEVVYRGAIDDQIGYDGRKDAPTRRFLATALSQHLAGEPVDPAKTRSYGCVITRTQ